jgi:Ca2+:H+ antiporter
MKSHHGLYDDVLQGDSHKDDDRHRDLNKPKLTMTEAVIALIIALVTVSFMAVFLVKEIEFLVEEKHVRDA